MRFDENECQIIGQKIYNVVFVDCYDLEMQADLANTLLASEYVLYK